MKKTTFINNLKYIFLGTVVAIGLSYVVQAAPSPVGSGNPDAPLNVGATAQTKTGALTVWAFNAQQNAQFDGSTFFHGALLAPSANSTISFGGMYNGVARNAGLSVSGTLSNTGTLAAATLVNGTNNTVCADANGTVVLCDGVVTPPPSNVHEFLATGSSYSSYTGFALGQCGSWGDITQQTNGFYNFIHMGTTSCASYANGDDGSHNGGFDVQLDFSNVATNTLSGFNGVSGQFVHADYYNRPPSYWTAPAAGYYQVDISGTMGIETKLKDGNYIFVAGVFLRAEKQNDLTSFTEYPIAALSGTGHNAVLEGSGCTGNKAVVGEATDMYSLGIVSYNWYNIGLGNSQIQYGQRGSCNDTNGSSWDTPGSFGLSFHQSIYLNAGDKLYTFAKVAGVGYSANAASGGDARDIDVFITQSSNSIHIVQQ